MTLHKDETNEPLEDKDMNAFIRRCGDIMEKSKMVQENKLGTFSVSEDLLMSESETLMEMLFSNVLIVRCEHMHCGVFKYIAFSELFEPANRCCEPPNYNIVFARKDSGELEMTAIINQSGTYELVHKVELETGEPKQ